MPALWVQGAAMSRQLDLIERPPRKAPQKLMHVCDAGEAEGKPLVQMECSRCWHRSDWLVFDTVTEAKRGLPCPQCNHHKE